MNYFIIFAGPNGSGKSSVQSSTTNTNPILKEKNLSLSDFQYINADFCARNNPDIAQMPPGIEKDKAAWEKTETWRNSAMLHGENIIWETVFSDTRRLDEINKAHQLGYYVIVLYITTLNPEINLERIKIRVQNGGHGVPDDKVLQRYQRSVKLLPALLQLTDEAYVYDNSAEEPILIFRKAGSFSPNHQDTQTTRYYRSKKNIIGFRRWNWVTEHIVIPLEEQNCIIQS